MKPPRRILLITCFAAGFVLSASAQFTPPTIDRVSVTVDGEGVLVSPENFFFANGFDVGTFQLLAENTPRVDWLLGRLYGPSGPIDTRLDWGARTLSGFWESDNFQTGDLFVTGFLGLPAGGVQRAAIAPKAIGPAELDDAGNYTAKSLTLTDFLRLRAVTVDPPDPEPGEAVIWMSSGADTGDAGDIIIRIRSGATTKTITLIDFSEE